MNRLSFLKKLGIGAAAVVIAPKVIAETPVPTNHTEGLIPFMRRTRPALNAEEVLRIRRQTGDLIYQYPLTFDECFKDTDLPKAGYLCFDEQANVWMITKVTPRYIALKPTHIRHCKGEYPYERRVAPHYFRDHFIINIYCLRNKRIS